MALRSPFFLLFLVNLSSVNEQNSLKLPIKNTKENRRVLSNSLILIPRKKRKIFLFFYISPKKKFNATATTRPSRKKTPVNSFFVLSPYKKKIF
ncbi:Hypothetical protein Minf_1280 [Methylacidiphilum infernorum V4]|uniref:Uncharacterized protein n=1 Tax=Methylacidiphilum infernorum (isolate V4) TaxID=481448 RepID=B3DVI1_METI4|nr:Hypothetical protein Minf_1280 [Methylacidiphilum infernorum V4]